jgi:alkylation response protein AidB-like acyl-CoA dehydrogenase
MSLAGALGGHTVVSKLLLLYGTDQQKEKYLPSMATGELRATMALTEPGGGSDLQAMRTGAGRDGDDYVINGTKTWISNARRSGLVALLCKTDREATPAHRGVSILLVEKVPGFTVSKDLPKLGYKGVESCDLNFTDARVPADALLGATEGFRADDEGPGGRPSAGRGARHRGGSGGVRRCVAVRPAPGELRQADLAAPVGRQHARRHGHQAVCRSRAALQRGREVRLG